MGHFAKVVDGIVTQVIIAEPEFFETYVDPVPGQWIQTSYNTRGGVHYDPTTNKPSADQTKALRKNYAGQDYTYDAERDAFIPPKPYDSWILDEQTCWWWPPVKLPEDAGKGNPPKLYAWDESTLSWKER